MKLRIEHFIIVILVGILVLDTSYPAPEETKVVERITTVLDSSRNSGIKNQKPEKIKILEFPDKIEKVKAPEKLPKAEKEKVREVNRYRDTTYFEGSKIFSEIISEGRILETSILAEIDHRETTITNTRIKNAAGFFISPGLDYSPVHGLEGVETTLTYIKGNWGLGAGAYYNFRTIPSPSMYSGKQNSLGFKLKIYIKL